MTDLTKIIKRDGTTQAFDEQKIVKALRAAFGAAQGKLTDKQVESEATTPIIKAVL